MTHNFHYRHYRVRRPITTNQSSFSNLRNLKHEPLKPENPKTTNTRQSCNPAKEISQHHQDSTNCNWREVYLRVTTVVPRCERPTSSPPSPASAWGARLTPSPPSPVPACRSARPTPSPPSPAPASLLKRSPVSSVSGARFFVEALARLLRLGRPLVKALAGLLRLRRPLGAHARLCLLRLRCPLVC